MAILIRACALFGVVGSCVLILAPTAMAHPAGLTSINRYMGVECGSQGQIRVAYLLDFAEMPSYSEIDVLDADKDDAVTPEERRAYLDRRLPPLVARWSVEVNGVRATPHVVTSNLEVREGEGGLSTLRIAADVLIEGSTTLEPAVREVQVRIRDTAFADHSGWREMAAHDSANAVVVSGFKETPSEALSYANGAGPPRVDEAEFVFRRIASTPAPFEPPGWNATSGVDPRLLRLSMAIRRASGSWLFSLSALALAMALGAAHALSPGHGKALAATFLVGHRARPSQALVFGTTVTMAHTFVVFLLGGLALTIERTVGSDRLMRTLEVLSAVMVLALGFVQFSRRWRELVSQTSLPAHTHVLETEASSSVVALGTSSGLTPCPSALAVLLTAIAIHRFGFGLALVVAFSLGVALTLTAAGLLVVMARRLLDDMMWAAPLLRWLPVISSACVLLIGVFLCTSACWLSVPHLH